MCVVLVKVNPRAQFPKKEVEVRKELLFLGESMNDWQHMNEYMYVCVCVQLCMHVMIWLNSCMEGGKVVIKMGLVGNKLILARKRKGKILQVLLYLLWELYKQMRWLIIVDLLIDWCMSVFFCFFFCLLVRASWFCWRIIDEDLLRLQNKGAFCLVKIETDGLL